MVSPGHAQASRWRPDLFAASLLAATLLLPSPAAADWRTCDLGVFDVTGGEAVPEVVRPGEQIFFRINGTLDRDVDAGVLEVWVDYLGFHVYSKKGDLCEAAACPLAKGEHSLEFWQTMPRVAPPGPYLGVFQVTAEGGPLLFCVDINFRVSLTAGSGSSDAGQPS